MSFSKMNDNKMYLDRVWKKTIDQSFSDKSVKDELYDLWHTSVVYFNEVMEILKDIPDNLKIEILYIFSRATLATTNSLSRATYAESPKEFNAYLRKALDSELTTISCFKIIRQFGCIHKGQFEDVIREGEKIKERIIQLIDHYPK